MARDSEQHPHNSGCCQVRMIYPSTASLHTSCFGVNPAPSTSGENRADLFQHTELQDMDSKGLPSSSWQHSWWFLLLSLVGKRLNHVHTVSFEIYVPAYFSDQNVHVRISQEGSQQRGKHRISFIGQLWVQIFSLNRDRSIQKSCSLPRHHPPQTHPCYSSYTAPSGCFYQTQPSVLAHGIVVLEM